MSEHLERINRLQQRLQLEGIGGFVITQNVDVYYLTGSMQSGYLVIPAEGEARFYVRRSVSRAREESAVTVEPLGSLRSFAAQLAAAAPELAARRGPSPVRLAAEFDVLPVQGLQRLQQALPHAEWVDGSALIRECRMVKSPSEIALIRQAAQLIDEALSHALERLQPGMTELAFMSEVEYFIRHRGHLGLMRMRGFNQEAVTGMLASGEAAAVPTYFDGPAGGRGLSPACPQSASLRPIGANEPILIDLGCCVGGYVIDQTRTVVIGELEEELEAAYRVSEGILRQAEVALQPGAPAEALYLQALQMAAESGLGGHFMGYAEDQVRFLGHGIGLEVDELPVLARGFRTPLAPGMVIAIEPKFTFPGRGVVGIEDSYLVTDTGFERLTVTRQELIRL